MEWLVPFLLFWTLSALYLGGMSVEVVGGGPVRQLMGLFDSFVLYVALWAGLRVMLGGLGGLLWGAVLPTALATLALPAIVWAGYMIVGIRVQKGESPH